MILIMLGPWTSTQTIMSISSPLNGDEFSAVPGIHVTMYGQHSGTLMVPLILGMRQKVEFTR